MSAARSFPTFATLVSLGLLSACFGKREEPTIQSLGTGNVGGHNAAGGNGGDGGNGGGNGGNGGGNGGATDGGGGANPDGGGGGTGGTPADGGGGSGGGAQGSASDIYPLCGCIADFNGAGACRNCVNEAFVTVVGAEGTCAEISAACNSNPTCVSMLNAMRNCNPVDADCLDAVADLDPANSPVSFDDLVSLMECGCNACAFCDEAACE